MPRARGPAAIEEAIPDHRHALPWYNVRFFRRVVEGAKVSYIPEMVKVSVWLPVRANQFVFALGGWKTPTDEQPVPLWPALLEKGYAQFMQMGYGGLDAGRGGGTFLRAVLGQDTTHLNADDKGAFTTILGRLEANEPVLVSSDNHYWSVVHADENGITLRDPRSKAPDAAAKLPPEQGPDFLKSDRYPHKAHVRLSWEDFRKHLANVTVLTQNSPENPEKGI